MSRATPTAADRPRAVPTRVAIDTSDDLDDASAFTDRNLELFRHRDEVLALLRTSALVASTADTAGTAGIAEASPDDQGATADSSADHLRRRLDDVTAEIIEFNRGLVRSYCRRFTSSSDRQDTADFEAAGLLGLMRAIDSFDPDQGRFGTWAFQPIRREVLRAVRDADHPNVNFGDFERRPEILRAARALQHAAGGVAPTHDEVAEVAGVTSEQVRRVLDPPRLESIHHAGLDGAEVGGDRPGGLATPRSGAATLGDGRDDPEATVLARLTVDALERYGLTALDARERHVIVRRYGLDGEPEDTLADIGATLGVARETVRQIEVRALTKLRRPEIAARFSDLVPG